MSRTITLDLDELHDVLREALAACTAIDDIDAWTSQFWSRAERLEGARPIHDAVVAASSLRRKLDRISMLHPEVRP